MSDDQLPLEPSPELVLLYSLAIIRPGDRVLDAGCFRGDDVIYLATGGCRATGMDMSRGAIDYARRVARAFGVQASARFLCGVLPQALDRCADASFDVVSDRLLLSNLGREDAGDYLRSVARVLRAGGLFVVRYGSEAKTPLHARQPRLPGAWRRLGFDPFRWHDGSGEPRRSRPVRLALHPHRFGFCREAVFQILMKSDRG